MTHEFGKRAILAALFWAVACDRPSPTAVEMTGVTSIAAARASSTREVVEFDQHVSADFFLTCINEMTHWEGPVHVTASTTTTPGGPVISKFRGDVSSEFFIERADGTRYHANSSAGQMATIVEGPASVISVTSHGAFKSSSGDVLPTTVHMQVVVRGDDVIVENFVGAGP